jgi:1-acyl-sn-glycerol-3-phosphate acyltransferase
VPVAQTLPPARKVRALWRLVQLAWLAASGCALVRWRFPALDAAVRHAHVQRWARRVLAVLDVDLQVQGALAPGAQLLVANHVSWLDILALQCLLPASRFVAKADLQRWPVVRTLAHGANALFVERDRPRQAREAVEAMTAVLRNGGTVVVFPEGTTSDGLAVLPFRTSLLQSALHAGTRVQPVALRYSEHGHALSPSAPYIGDVSLLQSLWRLSRAEALVLTLAVLPPHAMPHPERRLLAQALHRDITAALP